MRAGLGDRKIIAWDHNRDLIYQRVSTILADPKAAQYVWGIGFHWYEPWSGGTMIRLARAPVRATASPQDIKTGTPAIGSMCAIVATPPTTCVP